MTSDIQIITAPYLNVKVSSNINSFTAEKRFDKSLTIGELKGRLELITGGSTSSMVLEVYDEGDTLICKLSDDSALLGSYQVEENYRIHVIDNAHKTGEFEDFSKVDKFELSEDEYSKRTDSVRSFLLKNKLGKYNEDEQARIQEEKEKLEMEEEDQAKAMKVGDRCEVKVQGESSRRGEVKFIGKTHFKLGWWIGVQFDEPLGKNDGSVGGQRYFEAPNKYGGFVRPSTVQVGDFPEIHYDLDEI